MKRLHFHICKTKYSVLLGIGVYLGIQGLFMVGIHREWIDFRPIPSIESAILPAVRREFPTQLPSTVVLLGSCRTRWGLFPDELSRYLSAAQARPIVVCNYGILAGGPLTEWCCLRGLLSRGLRPDLAIVEVFPSLLTDTGDTSPDVVRLQSEILLPEEVHLLAEFGADPSQAAIQGFGFWLGACHWHRFNILGRFSRIWLPKGSANWWPNPNDVAVRRSPDRLDPERRREARRRMLEDNRRKAAHIHADFHPGPSACRAFRAILETGRRENIPMILLLPPEATVCRQWWSADSRQRLMALLADWQNEFQIPLINATEWITDEGFSDAWHLTADGPAQYTRRLGEVELPSLLANIPRWTTPKETHRLIASEQP